MKKQILLPFVLLGAAGLITSLGACQPRNQEEKPEEGYGIAITNKDALQETWYAGTSRALDIELTPAGNVMQEYTTGALKIESSNPDVVSITGANANALAEGQATVTVKYHGWKDTVDLTISHKQTNKEKYGTQHEGTLEDPFDNEDACLVGAWVKDNGENTPDVYVTGTVRSWYHAPGSRTDGAVSWFLEPAQAGGERFEVYKCFKDGATGDASKLTYQDVWKGGTIIAHGPITYYADGKQAEFTGSQLVSCTGGTKPAATRQVVDATFAEVLTLGAGLDDGDSEYDYRRFDAYVTKQDGSNYFLTATQGEELNQQTSDAAHGAKKYYANAFEIYGASDAVAAKLLKNAKVTVTVSVKNYHGQVETDLAVAEDQVVVVTPGSPWVIPEHNATVAQGLEVINGLADGATTEDLYIFTEVYVKAVTGAYNTQYGNMSFTIADTADGTNTITVFRALTDATTAAKVVAGAQVTIKGNLQKYVKNDQMTPELLNVKSITVKESGEGGGGGEQTIDPLAAPLAISFASLASGSEFTTATALAALKAGASTENAALITEVSNVSKVYAGNGSGGAHDGQAGMIKFGTSKANGTITIVFGAKFNKVEISCHDFYAPSDQYPTNSNKIVVNAGTETLTPYNANGEFGTLTFSGLTETNTLTIASVGRLTIQSITLSYVAA